MAPYLPERVFILKLSTTKNSSPNCPESPWLDPSTLFFWVVPGFLLRRNVIMFWLFKYQANVAPRCMADLPRCHTWSQVARLSAASLHGCQGTLRNKVMWMCGANSDCNCKAIVVLDLPDCAIFDCNHPLGKSVIRFFAYLARAIQYFYTFTRYYFHSHSILDPSPKALNPPLLSPLPFLLLQTKLIHFWEWETLQQIQWMPWQVWYCSSHWQQSTTCRFCGRHSLPNDWWPAAKTVCLLTPPMFSTWKGSHE